MENKENIESTQNKMLNETHKLEDVPEKSENIHQSLFSPIQTKNEVKLDNVQFEEEISFDTKKKLTYEDEDFQEEKTVVKVLIKDKKKNIRRLEDTDDIAEV